MLAQGPARPLVVVMVGTAVTVEAIDAQGRFLGGLILPGHGIMLRALESGTAGLHAHGRGLHVSHQHQRRTDQRRHLRHCRCGGAHGATRDCPLRQEPACMMTGGAGWKMAPSMTRPFELVDNLIFDGLLEIAARRFA
jgi:type III pantothenate kinase